MSHCLEVPFSSPRSGGRDSPAASALCVPSHVTPRFMPTAALWAGLNGPTAQMGKAEAQSFQVSWQVRGGPGMDLGSV